MRHALIAAGFVMVCGPALAGAWTQKDDSWQVISGLIGSDASHSFGGSGPGSPVLFQRVLLQTDTEYGWNDDLTLFLRTETAYARVRDAGAPFVTTAVDNAFEGGARYRVATDVLSDYDVVSVEGTLRTAGAFNFTVSANSQAGGRDAGLRVLYGMPFTLDGRNGFLDVELAERWMSAPRPDESALDVTAGWWLSPTWMVMLQSFNIVSGPAQAPYSFFRSHKLEASAVWKLSDRYSVQAGAYLSPAGQNALEEQGVCLSVWADL